MMSTTPRTPPPAQQPLPFDDEADRPVPYALTARARRAVAPDALPELEVVAPRAAVTPPTVSRASGREARAWADPSDGALDEPEDTRPARARALRRAGTSVAQIARQLGVEELTVRAWVGDLGGRGGTGPTDATVVALPGIDPGGPRRDETAIRRLRAKEDARARLAHDPDFAAGLGVLVGAGHVDAHGVGLVTTDRRVAAVAVAWLVEHAGVEVPRIRVVLRLGRKAAGDVARHAWHAELGLPLEQISHTRSRAGLSDDAVEGLIHVTDEALAARVAGWRDALLDPAPTPLDAAF